MAALREGESKAIYLIVNIRLEEGPRGGMAATTWDWWCQLFLHQHDQRLPQYSGVS
jgi:hypothetical protein